MISRRRLLTGFVLAWAPLGAAAAQEYKAGKVYRVGILATYPVEPFYRPQFVAALRDLGYIEGQNLALEIRSANNMPERIPALAVELVRLNVDVIVTGGDAEVAAAQQATRTIPIVMAPSGDPVRAGYVASLARPGGNITGFSFRSPDLSAKVLEVLKDAVPKLSRVAVLWNPASPTKVLDFDETQRAAHALRLTVSSIEVKAASELERAFTAITRARPDALLILVDQVLDPIVRARIAAFAMTHHLPSIAGNSNYLLKTPRDDWDLAPHPIDATLPVNPLKAEHQLFFRWLSTRYTPEVAWAHWVRVVAIDAWVPGNRSALIARGLIRHGPAGEGVSLALLQAITELPYELRGGERTFDLKAVMRRTDELIETETCRTRTG